MKTRQAILFSLALVILDQLTKWLVRSSMALGSSVPLFLGIRLTHVRNTGAGFGILQNSTPLLIIISVIILGFIVWDWKRIEDQYTLPVALVLGGLFGNLIDRAFVGAVTDFVHLGWFPIFNVADTALSVAALWLIFLYLRECWEKRSRDL